MDLIRSGPGPGTGANSAGLAREINVFKTGWAWPQREDGEQPATSRHPCIHTSVAVTTSGCADVIPLQSQLKR